ncbi:hypothetical protein D9757_002788 [Collybiopsis confluens]|uniref:Alginate lyase domain-containing protein n=1 Tax=Collybiopsis confluens TaxID=2823264 RepID=A0A8H5HW23_9AGAR|nr:hypothetical protein D9757_002788 [Collybiopsis confluens]
MLSLFISISALAIQKVLGNAPRSTDPTDFINPDYVIQHSNDPPTKSARIKILHNAQAAAAQGPWSIQNGNGITPPSGDPRDYLSWAPYHWPNCNWCSAGHSYNTHSKDDGEDGNFEHNDPYSDLGPGEDTSNNAGAMDYTAVFLASQHKRIVRSRRSPLNSQDLNPASALISNGIPEFQAPFGASVPSVPPAESSMPISTSSSIESSTTVHAAIDNTKPSKTSCTPSPSTPLPPSATWTMCPYVVRDGKVNPDVRSLRGAGAINLACDAILNNAQAYAFTGEINYGRTMISTLNTLLFDQKTGMKPNMNYGQVVRGPGKQNGSFTGPLDLRGLIKVMNAILVIRQLEDSSSGSFHQQGIVWTQDIDRKSRTWMSQYLEWLTTSSIGNKARSRPNNHASFYHNSLASLYVALDRMEDARKTLDEFFKGPFLEQIAKSGEQPFEAVRTRPDHYRSFNLEALIAMAKLGDYLGQNYWDAKSRHGATIRDAVNFLMSVDPKKETEVAAQAGQHVAAAQAIYGPCPEYSAYLNKLKFEEQSYWYYDQPSAFKQASSSRCNKMRSRTVVWRRDSGYDSGGIQCPDMFKEFEKVEIDNGIFVTCADVLPFILGQV